MDLSNQILFNQNRFRPIWIYFILFVKTAPGVDIASVRIFTTQVRAVILSTPGWYLSIPTFEMGSRCEWTQNIKYTAWIKHVGNCLIHEEMLFPWCVFFRTTFSLFFHYYPSTSQRMDQPVEKKMFPRYIFMLYENDTYVIFFSSIFTFPPTSESEYKW